MKAITLLTKPVPVNQKYFVVRGKMLLSTKYRDTKEAMMWEVKSQVKGKPLAGPVKLSIDFYYGDNRKRDIDAYLKILLDAMCGVVYEDDSQIVTMNVTKGVDKVKPRTVIHIL